MIGSRSLSLFLCVVLPWWSQLRTTVEGTVFAPNVRTTGAVVYLIPTSTAALPTQREQPIIDQINLRFAPVVLPVLPGTTVEFRNSDPILHNVFSPSGGGSGFDLGTYPRTDSRFHTFTDVGPHVILCHVHPEMAAYVLVVPTPYHAVVDEAGRFRIDNVPPGRYEVRVWHRRAQSHGETIVVGNDGHLRLDLRLG